MLFSARTVWLGVLRDDGKLSCLEWTRNHFLLSPSYHDESWRGVEEDPSDSPRRFPCSFPRSGRSRIEVDVLRTWSPPESFYCSVFDWENIMVSPFWALTLPLHWVFLHRFQMRPSFPVPQCLRPKCLLSRFSPRATHIQGTYLVRLPGRTDEVATGLSQK